MISGMSAAAATIMLGGSVPSRERPRRSILHRGILTSVAVARLTTCSAACLGTDHESTPFSTTAAETSAAVIYGNDFESDQVGEEPQDGFILDGTFHIRRLGANQVLELPGEPLGSFGVLFGPRRRSDSGFRARILSDRRGRRLPQFSVGLNGRSGIRLRIRPAARSLELLHNDEVAASVPFVWLPSRWTWLDLTIRTSTQGVWTIDGKAWQEGTSNGVSSPATITIQSTEPPSMGRASVWGTPYSGKPIFFDDLALRDLALE